MRQKHTGFDGNVFISPLSNEVKEAKWRVDNCTWEFILNLEGVKLNELLRIIV